MTPRKDTTENPISMDCDIREQYEANGFALMEGFLNRAEVESIAEVVDLFHKNWMADNLSFYQEQAINSAYLTGTKYLEQQDRIKLFEALSSNKILDVVLSLPLHEPAFMNTQLFFDPANPEQKNYWHRDGQYHLSIEEQKQALKGPEVLHFRIALKDEPGIELVPSSHRRWDSEEELNTRLEQSDRNKSDDLSTGHAVPMSKGDLLIFSGNMIHRGLYGKDRMALDILFCEARAEFFKFAQADCFPDSAIIERLENPVAMMNALKIMRSDNEPDGDAVISNS